MVFTPLATHHDRKSFDCGVESVTRYLRQFARQQSERGLALTYVLTSGPDSSEIFGYYTLLMSAVSCDVIPVRGLPRGRVAPVVLLAQLGVDTRRQGQGLGKSLLYHALLQARKAADHVGCLAVVLDAVDDPTAEFYRLRGFEALTDDPRHLWMPMSAIRELFPD
ncbi:MAG: GNAT family N-acetyltransferase [Actinomycetota bacterium]